MNAREFGFPRDAFDFAASLEEVGIKSWVINGFVEDGKYIVQWDWPSPDAEEREMRQVAKEIATQKERLARTSSPNPVTWDTPCLTCTHPMKAHKIVSNPGATETGCNAPLWQGTCYCERFVV